MSLTLIEGPAGAGKSGVTALMLAAREIQVIADVTELWAALSGAVRGPDGRYPVRLDDDPALALARYLQTVAVRRGLQDGADVGVTTSTRNRVAHWRQFAEEAGTAFAVRTVDPGRQVVEARLSDADGVLSDACDRAIRRWYG